MRPGSKCLVLNWILKLNSTRSDVCSNVIGLWNRKRTLRTRKRDVKDLVVHEHVDKTVVFYSCRPSRSKAGQRYPPDKSPLSSE